ncbi:M61 family peptidase [Neisseria sp. ZJ106]|uniref:M61 family peptidase n=1 Tax=Neisseria lisongii TaxID=2912188 RepID=A0ABY7RHA4_9NEIS|nr:M61 family peptidase [Neisseria lisongii]MCF7521764.1 M61 family peptidase [Neisseria lisongii]WCL70999.1 M61 family peptidase [Neisseria lisongii]
MLNYTVRPKCLPHEWEITLSFIKNNTLPLEISLPNWVPGSYLVRDFSRHITSLKAFCNKQPAVLQQKSKNIWTADACEGEWQICYTVYAFDTSVRGAFLNTERGFFDGACLFLRISGYETLPHRLTFEHLPERWQTATSMPQIAPHTFQTASYAEFIDHPFEFGQIEFLEFEAAGIAHRIALSGIYPEFDRNRLINDVQKICAAELAAFPAPAPFTEYLFLLHLGDNIYGGLEHLSSTALQSDRHSLPAAGMEEADDAYTQLLGLFSHEYFHAWNVKSIKPAAFAPYDLNQECYTEQLWAFEGITSYYDDLFLARSGVIAPEAYLKLLGQLISRIRQTPGRLKQSLAESSFTAWNKFYKQDENSSNAIVSYYQKGALAALCLDLTIRRQSNGKTSLDNVMRRLYQDWLEHGTGIPEGGWEARCQEITGLNLEAYFQTALSSTDELPLENCLQSAGITLEWQQPNAAAPIGARFTQHADHAVLTQVLNSSSAENGGLCPHDKIIALNGYACTDLAAQWRKLAVGDSAAVHFFRNGILRQTVLTAQAAEADTAALHIADQRLFENWLFNH